MIMYRKKTRGHEMITETKPGLIVWVEMKKRDENGEEEKVRVQYICTRDGQCLPIDEYRRQKEERAKRYAAQRIFFRGSQALRPTGHATFVE